MKSPHKIQHFAKNRENLVFYDFLQNVGFYEGTSNFFSFRNNNQNDFKLSWQYYCALFQLCKKILGSSATFRPLYFAHNIGRKKRKILTFEQYGGIIWPEMADYVQNAIEHINMMLNFQKMVSECFYDF